ncbi:MAG: FAD-linked oxidase C-terminal domain-containing protein [Planctomycetaceae bacterium]
MAGSFAGDLRFDRVSQALYATDASLYEIAPLGVAFPRHVEDLQVLARYAEEFNFALVPRGAGTGLAGGGLGGGLIVDCSRYLTNIRSIGEETVEVESGVVLDTLNARLRQQGRYFPPDPSNASVTTIGGMLGVDAAGSHAIRVGSTRDHVVNIDTVHAGGVRCVWGNESLEMTRHRGGPGDTDTFTFQRIAVSRLAHLLKENRDLILQRQPGLIRNCAGYHLRGLLADEHVNVPRLLVGSEGTLGMFASATLHTIPIPPHRGVALLLFGRMDVALDSVQRLVEQQPSACDLIDRRLLSLGRDADARFERIIPQTAEAALIIEQTAYTEAQARQRIRLTIDAARAADASMQIAAEGYRPEEIDFLWSLPRKVVPNLTRLTGATRPQPFVEDIAVPPPMLRETLRRAQQLMQKYRVTASLYAHAASGQIHLRPFLPLPTSADAQKIEALARELYDVVLSVGGTISGEHGDGLSRTSFLRTQYGPMYRLFREVKDIFDPHNLLNPGKIVSDNPHLTIQNFRALPARTAVATDSNDTATVVSPETTGAVEAEGLVPLQLVWSREQLADEALRCNGCGVCRTDDAQLRMCPLFREQPDEAASPRAKANAVRMVLTGFLDSGAAASEEMKRVADYCFNCKQCQIECPSHVDIPHLAIEAKSRYVAANGLRRGDWALAHAHSFGRLGQILAPVSNWLLNSRTARWLLERVVGIARDRKLPRFASRTFLGSVGKTHSVRSGPLARGTVVYFVDHYANYHDTQLAWSFVRLLELIGIPVYVPPEQTASGMAMISAGTLRRPVEWRLVNVRAARPVRPRRSPDRLYRTCRRHRA